MKLDQLAVGFCFILLLVIQPSFGQTETSNPEKMAEDQALCQKHAMASSGYNPAAPAPQAAAPRPQRGAGLRAGARGAARGAVAGGIVEEIDDDGDRNDAVEVGAALGAAKGVSKGRRAARAEAKNAPPPTTGDPDVYSKSYNDCMASKGYEVQ